MSKHICLTAVLFICLGLSSYAQKNKQSSATPSKTDVKFLDDITAEAAPIQVSTIDSKAAFSEFQFNNKKTAGTTVTAITSIEEASKLQFKYGLLLDTEVEEIKNIALFRIIDEWFGTRYQLGGSSKSGIDCSALMQVFFTSLYGITIPRTSKEQYSASKRISREELKEGDLLFFNTVGGVSHVGMYLQNNKFVHASSNGVTISDMFDEYWMRHMIGVGRIEITAPATANL